MTIPLPGTIFPQKFRNPARGYPYGSATLAISHRIGVGSVFQTNDVFVGQDHIKTFLIRSSRRGSWIWDVSATDKSQYFTIATGTVPGGRGSVRSVSIEEAVALTRIRFIPLPTGAAGSIGSVSVFYGGFAHPSPSR